MAGTIPFRLFAAAAFAAAALASCAVASPATRPVEVSFSASGGVLCKGCNLVVVSMTNLRKDHLPMYGYGRDTVPNLAAFFSGGVRLDGFQTPASWTLPVAASLFTSKYPYEHHVTERLNGVNLPPRPSTLAEVLSGAGYRTAAFVGGGDYDRKWGFSRGFQTYVDEEAYAGVGVDFKDSAAFKSLAAPYLGYGPLSAASTAWLGQDVGRPFFLFVQGFGAHCPFTPAPPFDTKFGAAYTGSVDYSRCLWTFGSAKTGKDAGGPYWDVQRSGIAESENSAVRLHPADLSRMLALYDGEIAQEDAALAPLLAALRAAGRDRDTVFVFLSEHGDLFGEGDRFMRGGPLRGTFLEPVLSPPMLVKLPSGAPAAAVSGLFEAVDFLPSVLGVLGVPDPDGAARSGADRRAIFAGAPGAAYAYAGSDFFSEGGYFTGTTYSESVTDGRDRFVREGFVRRTGISWSDTLYGLASDPTCRRPIACVKSDVCGRFGELLDGRFGPLR